MELCRRARDILYLVLPLNPALTSPPDNVITEGWKKTNSTKRDKSRWEHVRITHRPFKNTSGSSSDWVQDRGLGRDGAYLMPDSHLCQKSR